MRVVDQVVSQQEYVREIIKVLEKKAERPEKVTNIRTILCEKVNAAIKTNTHFNKGIYKGLVIRRGRKRAVVAIRHRIFYKISTYSMLIKTGSVYKDPKIDYEAMMVKKNAPDEHRH